ISLTSSGIEQIHGPITTSATDSDKEQRDQVGEDELEQAGPELIAQQPEQLPASPIEPVTPATRSILNTLIDKLGRLLNLLADAFIRLIVKLGETVLS